MRTLTILAGALLVLALLPRGALAAGDPAAGKQKAQTCAACHGADGNSATAIWPSIAGQGAEYLRKQLEDLRSNARQNEQMSPMAAGLSDADIADLSAYFAGQTRKVGAADPAHVADGQRIYRAGDAARGLPACMACHGPTGAGNPAAAYPALSGQHAAYTEAQLKAFKAEHRANDTGAVMRSISSKMTKAEIESVSAYIQGLH